MPRNVTEWKVEVYPDTVMAWERLDPDQQRRRCEDIVAQVRRHVDGVRTARVMPESFGCSFCGASWTETSFTYNGGCCDADEANNPAFPQNSSPEER